MFHQIITGLDDKMSILVHHPPPLECNRSPGEISDTAALCRQEFNELPLPHHSPD